MLSCLRDAWIYAASLGLWRESSQVNTLRMAEYKEGKNTHSLWVWRPPVCFLVMWRKEYILLRSMETSCLQVSLLCEVTCLYYCLSPFWLGFWLSAAKNIYLIVIIVSSAIGTFLVFKIFFHFLCHRVKTYCACRKVSSEGLDSHWILFKINQVQSQGYVVYSSARVL